VNDLTNRIDPPAIENDDSPIVTDTVWVNPNIDTWGFFGWCQIEKTPQFSYRVDVLDIDLLIYGDVNPYSVEGIDLFRAWCADNGVTYVGEGTDSGHPFNTKGAFQQCVKDGNHRLMMEDLS
jgi:hypothetical protein